MADRSRIEWTDATWNPIRARYWECQDDGSGKERVGWHCEHVSEGCRNCYAERINRRLGTGLEFKPGNLFREERRGYRNGEAKLFLDERMLMAPLRWRRPRMVFVCSMTDLFADFVPDEWIDRVFAVMALAPQHTFQVPTKRAKRMREYLAVRDELDFAERLMRGVRLSAPLYKPWTVQMADWAVHPGHPANELPLSRDPHILAARQNARTWPLPNVWLGVSAERQQEADERVPDLLATPAAVRFVSAEPLLGPIDLRELNIDGFAGDPEPAAKDPAWRYNSLSGEHWFRGNDGFRYSGDGPNLARLDWVIVGGESGPNARPMHPDWARDLRDQCAAAGVPFFFKQWGSWILGKDAHQRGIIPAEQRFPFGRCQPAMARVGKKLAGRLLDGRTHDAMPDTGRAAT